MARYDRCCICDYSEQWGSSFANEPPSDKKVRLHNGEFFCDGCFASIADTVATYGADDDDTSTDTPGEEKDNPSTESAPVFE